MIEALAGLAALAASGISIYSLRKNNKGVSTIVDQVGKAEKILKENKEHRDKEIAEICGEIRAIKDKISLLETGVDFLKAVESHKEKEKKPKKKGEKPNQKIVAMSMIRDALNIRPHTLQEIVDLLQSQKIDLKRSTINNYISRDPSMESVEGKWKLKEGM